MHARDSADRRIRKMAQAAARHNRLSAHQRAHQENLVHWELRRRQARRRWGLRAAHQLQARLPRVLHPARERDRLAAHRRRQVFAAEGHRQG